MQHIQLGETNASRTHRKTPQVNQIFVTVKYSSKRALDGTYLVGTTCMITEYDHKLRYCVGLLKIYVLNNYLIDSYLLLGLLNSYKLSQKLGCFGQKINSEKHDLRRNDIYRVYIRARNKR